MPEIIKNNKILFISLGVLTVLIFISFLIGFFGQNRAIREKENAVSSVSSGQPANSNTSSTDNTSGAQNGTQIQTGNNISDQNSQYPSQVTNNKSSTSTSLETGTPGNNIPVNNVNNSYIIDSDQQKAVKASMDNQLLRQGYTLSPKSETRFEYELAPNLDNKKSFIPFSYAVESCNVDTAPDVLPIYQLKSNWNMDDAISVAKTFGIENSVPSSLPITGGYQYLLSNPETRGFLTFISTSGMYTYHRILDKETGDIGLEEAKKQILSEMDKHTVPLNLKPVSSGFDKEKNYYYTDFTGDWPPFSVVDQSFLVSLSTDSVCKIGNAQNVNYAKVLFTPDGQLAKFIIESRTFSAANTVPRLKLADAVSEYKNNLPVEPFIVGGSTSKTTGTVKIDEVTLVYYDFGDIYTQKMYLPMYLTGGTAALTDGTTARVITLFPAVSEDNLEKSNLIPPRTRALHLATFTPTPTPPPPPPPGSSMLGCSGGLIDYILRCTSVDGQAAGCSMSPGAPSNVDPYKICTEGCKNISDPAGEIIEIDGNQNPCTEYAKMKDLPGESFGGSAASGSTSTSGSGKKVKFSCILSGCPC